MIPALKLFFTGIVLGIGNVIPGVSGGTLAVIFNVYDRLIGVITLNIKKILREWKFWLPLLAGVVTGILLFSRLIEFLFDQYPVPVKFFFTGIILGSIPLIFRRAKKPGAAFPPVSGLVCAIAALAVMFCMAFLNPENSAASALFSNITVISVMFLFLAGMTAAVAMIIPGISGSFMLLAMGVYFTVIGSVSRLTAPLAAFAGGSRDIGGLLSALVNPLLILIPFGIGVIAGLLAGAALVRFLMKKAPLQTYGAILGLITGSIAVIFPRSGLTGFPVIIVSVIALLGGAALSAFFSAKDAARGQGCSRRKTMPPQNM
jgi:putative membrane protein